MNVSSRLFSQLPASLCLLVLGLSACDAPSDESVRGWLASAMRGDAEISIDSAHVRVVESWSRVSGLLYHEGFHWNPRVSHSGYWILGGSYRGQRRILRSLSDWNELVKLMEDTIRHHAIGGELCSELIRLVGPRANHVLPPLIYTGQDPATISLLDPLAVRLLMERRLTTPNSHSVDEGTAVELWAVEINRAARYNCTVTGDAVRLEVVDSIPDGGFIPIEH